MANSSTSHSQSIGPEKYYAIIRGQIEHQDNLIGQRLSWFVGAQAFLFTAYAITVSNSGTVSSFGPAHAAWVIDRMKLLLILIPLTSILTSFFIYLAVIAGLIAIVDLRRQYRIFAGHSPHTGLPPIQGTHLTQLLGRAAPLFIPLVFFVVWMVLLFQKNP
jgi:hypothetical protein